MFMGRVFGENVAYNKTPGVFGLIAFLLPGIDLGAIWALEWTRIWSEKGVKKSMMGANWA